MFQKASVRFSAPSIILLLQKFVITVCFKSWYLRSICLIMASSLVNLHLIASCYVILKIPKSFIISRVFNAICFSQSIVVLNSESKWSKQKSVAIQRFWINEKTFFSSLNMTLLDILNSMAFVFIGIKASIKKHKASKRKLRTEKLGFCSSPP